MRSFTRAFAATLFIVFAGCADILTVGDSSGSSSSSSGSAPECTNVTCKAIYQTSYGGGAEVEIYSLAEDEEGNVYLGIGFKGTLDLGLTPLQNDSGHFMSAIVKLDPGGVTLWQRVMGFGNMVRPYGGPLIVLGAVADQDNKLVSYAIRALDPDGEPLWETPFGDDAAFAACCDSRIALGASGDVLLPTSFYTHSDGSPFDFGGGVTLGSPTEIAQTWFVARWDAAGSPVLATNLDAAGIGCCPNAASSPSGETFVVSSNGNAATLSPEGLITESFDTHMTLWDAHFDSAGNRVVFGFLNTVPPNFGAGPITLETNGALLAKVAPSGEPIFTIKPENPALSYHAVSMGPSDEMVYADFDTLVEPPSAFLHKLDAAGDTVWRLEPPEGAFSPNHIVGPTGNVVLAWVVPGGLGVAKLPP